MKRFHHPLHRRGMTLVEVLLTITASTMVVGVAGGLLHRALRLEAASRGALQGERTALVLARQVRADIRAARTVACTADGLPADVVLRVQPAGEAAIVYRAVRGGLVREQAIPANRIAREAFSFPAAVRFESVRGDGVVSLVGAGGGAPGEGPPIDIEVVAALGAAASRGEDQP
jgi:hypothetical protein